MSASHMLLRQSDERFPGSETERWVSETAMQYTYPKDCRCVLSERISCGAAQGRRYPTGILGLEKCIWSWSEVWVAQFSVLKVFESTRL